MKLKYIVTDHGDFAIFSELTAHSDIGRSLFGKPIGAGFCKIKVSYIKPEGEAIINENREKQILLKHYIDIECYGESVSLKLTSRGKEDEDIIIKKLNGFEY